MKAWGYTKIKDSFIKDFLLKIIGIPHPYGRMRVKPVLEYLKISCGKTLDLGSGEGIWMMELSKRKANVYGVDVSLDALKNTQNILTANNLGSKIVQGNAQRIPFKSNSFDQIMCVEVLEHVEDPGKIFSEVGRCLKKDGQFVITVPNELYLVKSVLPFDLRSHTKAMGHVSAGINYETLKKLAEENGLKIADYKYLGKTFSRMLIELLYFLMGAKSIRSSRKKMYKYSYTALLAFSLTYPLMHLDYLLPREWKGAFIVARLVKK